MLPASSKKACFNSRMGLDSRCCFESAGFPTFIDGDDTCTHSCPRSSRNLRAAAVDQLPAARTFFMKDRAAAAPLAKTLSGRSEMSKRLISGRTIHLSACSMT